ncbi:hypothetical protein [Listeria costaricensis]|uniref:hypothetical protein n=1 Tax=Listeria costaricensis TaxID=2026604 RepID=UPI000C0779B0|nr:hypothetical protein [Listeria costaricensis]
MKTKFYKKKLFWVIMAVLFAYGSLANIVSADGTFSSDIVSKTTYENGELNTSLETELPKDMKFEIEVTSSTDNYSKEKTASVKSGGTLKKTFTDLDSGKYTITYTSLKPSKQKKSVKTKIGSNGENIEGSNVKDGVVTYSEEINIQKLYTNTSAKTEADRLIRTANSTLSSESLDAARNFIENNEYLNIDSYKNDIDTISKKITEANNTSAAKAEADKLLNEADQQVTADALNKAKDYINSNQYLNIQDYDSKISSINDKVTAKEEAAKKAADEADAKKAKEEQEAAAASQQQQSSSSSSAQAEQPTQNADDTTQVLVTPTGSKYHTHKCGNGTYTPTTLADAKARGLTPCSKCY